MKTSMICSATFCVISLLHTDRPEYPPLRWDSNLDEEFTYAIVLLKYNITMMVNSFCVSFYA